jgi:autotransporter-associated beta strand protein
LLLFVDSTSASPSGTATLFASGGPRVIGNAIQYPSGTNNLTLLVGGTNTMTFTGPVTLNGNDSVTLASYMMRTIQATNTGGTIISGSISDNNAGYGLVQSGTGTLYLDGANTYTGPTTNSAGTLAGMGSLTSAVYIQTNSSIGGGSAAGLGTLTISSNLTLNGNVFIRLKKSSTPDQSNDVIAVTGVLTNTGINNTVTVTNLGPALTAGDRFVLFTTPVLNGGALAVSGGGVTWSNRLAIDGSIVAATSPVATNSPYLTNELSGTSLTLQWPADHIGWQLQAQTNSHGISTNATNWVTVTGTSSTNKIIISIDPSKSAVFYRLFYYP